MGHQAASAFPDGRGTANGHRGYAFVGTGHRAEMYFAALLSSHSDAGRPIALCDTNPVRMDYYNELWQEANPGAAALPAYAAEDFAAMLDSERPDSVLVTTIDRTHHDYVRAALARGCAVIVEKPLTTSAEGCAAIVDAAENSPARLVVTFNYRYAPRNSAVKELIDAGIIGDVTSVHFEWLLDTVHGADYFRRWHRDKGNSGGLLVHKSTHHFDLVNWWLGAAPETVFAFAALRFYGQSNAEARGGAARHHRSHAVAGEGPDPFALDLAADPKLKRLYLDAEHEDGYLRDLDVFGAGISIEDNMSVLVRYDNGSTLTYSLNAHAPWEGYRVAINGTAGRLELDVCERAHVSPASAEGLVGRDPDSVVGPTAGGPGDRHPAPEGGEEARKKGASLLIQQHWEPARRVGIPEGEGGHGGADTRLLDDVFRGAGDDPLGRQAGYLDGVRSVLVGVAANQSVATGEPVRLADFGLSCAQGAQGPRAAQQKARFA